MGRNPRQEPRGRKELRRKPLRPGSRSGSGTVPRRRQRTFVGRQAELRVLRRALAEAKSGRGSLFVVRGPFGMGKTALLSKLAGEAQGRGFRVLRSACGESSSPRPFDVWAQLGSACVREFGQKQFDRYTRPFARVLDAVFGFGGGEEGRRGTDLSAAQGRQAISAVFFGLAESEGPLLVVCENLQWVDLSSLLTWCFIAPQLADSKVVVAATLRTPLPARPDRWQKALGDLERSGECLELEPFGPAEFEEFVRTRCSGWDDEQTARLRSWTGGNPLFAQEVLEMRERKGVRVPAHGAEALPHLVQGRLRTWAQGRLEFLDPDCRELFRLAAVCGEAFSPEILEALATEPGTVAAALETAMAEGILLREETRPGRLVFRHGLIRQALLQEVPEKRLRELHARIAEVLSSWADERRPDVTRAEVAYHCSLALPEIDTHRLVEARGKAAEEFSRHLAFPEAAAELREVLRTIAAHPESFPPRLEFENRLELARALRRAGEPEEAQAVLREACVLARGLEEPELLAVALLPFATGIDAGQVDAEKVAWLEYALDRLPPEREDLRSRLLARLSWELYWSGDAERCLALSDEALRLARKRGDRWVLAQVLSERWFSSWGVLPVGERLELSEELASLARSLADPELVSRSYHGRVVDFLELGMGQRLASEIRAHAKDPLMRREPVHVWLAAIWKTTLSLLRGSFARAGEDARAALELGKRAEPDNAAQAFFAHTYLLERARGFGEGFREGMEALARECPPALLVPVHAALASVMAESGEKEKAREAMEVALGSGLERGVLSMNWLPVLANLAEASWALRERRHAASLYARLEPARGRNVVLGPALGTLGPVDLYLGLLATLAGGFDEARGHFEKAGALARSLGSPPLVARVHCLFAEALAEARPANWQEEAGRSAERARVTASRLGMRAIGARAEGVLSGLRAPRASSRASPEDERVPNLFAREGEHWRVVYEGVALYVKDRRGMHYLALLLENPGREFYCLDLVQRVSGSAESIYDPPSTQPQVDPTARKAYQGRLRDLRAELAEAESASDLGRRESALEEIGWIEDELSRSAGLRGQRAEVPSAQERARVAVTKRIREAIREVGRQHAALGFHLRTTVKTGVTCVYVPPPGSPISWHT